MSKQSNIESIYPLSPAQQGMLFHTLYIPESTMYFQQFAFKILGDLNVNAFERAWQDVTNRHSILRTAFKWGRDADPLQIVLRKVVLPVEYLDWSDKSQAEQQESLERFLQTDRDKGFDFAKPPLMRISFIRLGENAYYCVWSHHHILIDGWSVEIVFQEVFTLYKVYCQGQEIQLGKVRPFIEYIQWLKKQDMTKAEAYWRNKMAGFSATTPLMFGKSVEAAAAEMQTVGKAEVKLSTEDTTKLRQFSRKNQLTLNTILQAAWAFLLSRYSGEEDVVYGATVSGRSAQIQGIESMVGMFINTLPVRVQFDDDTVVLAWLKSIQEQLTEIREYEYTPLVQIQSWSDMERGVPMFESIVVFENIPLDSSIREQDSALKFELQTVNGITNYPLTIMVIPTDELDIQITYDAKRFDCVEVDRILKHLVKTLLTIINNSTEKLSQFEIITEEEKQEILVDFNDTKADYPKEKTIHQLFEEQVEKTPDSVAVVFGDSLLTYRELNAKANQVARVIRQKGVKPDDIVGLMVERSLEMIIGIMGILKAGCAYLPVDPDYPMDRVKYMLDDSGTKLLVTYGLSLDGLDYTGEFIDLADAALYQGDATNLTCVNTSDDLAYVIYTSGSTGKPKGVMLEHRAVNNFIKGITDIIDFSAGKTILNLTTISFDIFVLETLLPLCHGVKIAVVGKEAQREAELLSEIMLKHNVDMLQTTPSRMQLLFDGLNDLTCINNLKEIMVGGEALPENLFTTLVKLPHTRIYNMYGPTETTVWSAVKELTGCTEINIGKPIANTQIYIVDKANNLQPIGIPGELCIAGDGLARGYYNRPELTAEKFIANPFEAGKLMYRTGDLARWLPNGEIEFIGRVDFQVKIRGYRIELGEIENELLKYAVVEKAVVVAKDDTNGYKYLCAYVVASESVSTQEFREHLGQTLPEYMVPAYFVQLEEFPLTPNGKVDRKALPDPDKNVDTGLKYIAPRNQTEEKLVEIWQEVLGVERAGITDNFFTLGGHSLKATVLAAKIHKVFNVKFPLSEIFKRPTVKELAEYLVGAEESIYKSIQPLAESAPYYAVSAAQKRLFVLNQLEENSTSYNMPGITLVEGNLDRKRLETVFKTIIQRHETLRTSFEMVEDEPVQRISDTIEFAIEYFEAEASEVDNLKENFIRPFDLARAPLIRIGLIKLDQAKHVLLYDMHHIISDGVSLDILVQEFSRLYNGEVLPELRLQYKDFAAWQNELFKSDEIKKQEAYWLDTFSGEIPVLNIPTDYPRPSVQSFEGSNVSVEIDSQVLSGLNAIATETGSTMYMVLLAAYNVLLAKYSGQEDIVVGSPIAGRPHADLQNIIGMFVNTLAIRNYPAAAKTFKEFLQDVRATALSVFENQDYQFDELVERLQIRRDLSRNPLFDAMFSMQNMSENRLDIADLKFLPYGLESKIAKFDLTLTALEMPEKMILEFEYCTKLFRQETIERMKEHFVGILAEIIANPAVKLAEIDMLSQKEKDQILGEFNATTVEYTKDKTINALFEAQVAKGAQNIAVVFEDKKLTYTELNEKANQLARLIRENGVKPGEIVGIMAERSVEMVVGLLAILKAGGAYLPIDPDYPMDRINYMLADSNAAVLLTQKHLTADIEFSGRIIDLDEKAAYTGDTSNLTQLNSANDLAYIIYTSGSTGKPKGVMIEHQGVANLSHWFNQNYDLETNRNVLQMTNISFDVSVEEIIVTLLNGATIFIPRRETILDREGFAAFIKDNAINLAQFVPTTLRELLLDEPRIETLNVVICGGEKLDDTLKDQVLAKGYNLYNHYGPTETTVDALVAKCTADKVNIGKPIANTQVYVVNASNMLVPVGVAGELCIAGDGLARGYLNRPELTAEKFVENPFTPGKKMYKTGDLVRWLADGNIDYLGRIDDQVKVRGFRIELGEIESKLTKLSFVKEAVVTAEDNMAGNKYLCAYIVTEEGKELTVADLRNQLSKELPDYMIPSYFIQLEKLPLTPNGKVDRKALPKPDGDINTGVEYVAPRNEKEELLANAWQEVLGVKRVGINDNFFDLGGDSIKAIQVAARLNKCQLKLEIKDLFQQPTIGELSKYIKEAGVSKAEQGIVSGKVELTPVQHWFFENIHTDIHHWNHAVMLYSEAGFEAELVKKAFQKLMEHHDALRMTYSLKDGEVEQYNNNLAEELFDLNIVDLTAEDEPGKIIEAKANALQSSIDLSRGPLLKLGLFKTKAGDHLLIVLHHLVVDGVSWRIIFEDLATAYEQAANNEEIVLPAKTESFKAWSQKLADYANSKELLREISFWQSLEKESVDSLPVDNQVVEDRVKDSLTLAVSLNEQETEKLLKNVNRAYNTEINDILLTALGVAVKAWTGQAKVLVSLEGHGREGIIKDTDITRTVGWFTSEYPVLLKVNEAKDLGYLIKETKESLRRIPNKGVGYGILKYLTAVDYKANLAFSLKPEISFNYLGQFGQDVDKGVFGISTYAGGDALSGNSERPCKLEINSMVSDKCLTISVSYNKSEYNESTISSFIAAYKKSLQEIIAHCTSKQDVELTPSDFGDLQLGIQGLAELQSRYGKAIEKIYPLIPMQEGMLFQALVDTESNAYFEQTAFDINGKLELELFEKSFAALIQRHEVLRTAFVYQGLQRPRQVVLKERSPEIFYQDISGLEAEAKAGFISDFKAKDKQRGFDLENDVLTRLSILKKDKEAYTLVWSSHHIIMDGWCQGIVIAEYFEIYSAMLENRSPKLENLPDYRNYIDWLERQDRKEARDYWANRLAGYENQAAIPTTKLKGLEGKYELEEISFLLDNELTQKLDKVAKKYSVTFNTVFQAIWSILLQRYNNIDDVVFGAVVSGRPAEVSGIDRMVGLFINTIPVRVQGGNKGFADLLKEIQTNALEAEGYAYYPLAEIQANTALKGNLLDHVIAFENYPVEEMIESADNDGGVGFTVANVEAFEQANYDFGIVVAPGQATRVTFKYNSVVYEHEFIKKICLHFLEAARSVADSPEEKVERISILSQAEIQQILHDFNNTKADYPSDKTIQELFEEQVEKTPENVALVFDGKKLTYRELNDRASQLAKVLRAQGVKTDTIVAIMVERSLEMVLGAIAILKAGGAYLPLDPDYPVERLEFMLSDSNAKILLTQNRLSGKVSFAGTMIDLEEEGLYQGDAANLEGISKVNDLAYVIYTSGSTGKPKGVMVEHRGVANLKVFFENSFKVNAKDRIIQFASTSFDASVWETFMALLTGAELHVLSRETINELGRFANYLNEHSITVATLPPTYLVNLEPASIDSLRLVITAGSATSFDLVEKWEKKVTYINAYGPTESTVCATAFDTVEMSGKNYSSIPIGKPIPNSAVYIVDKYNNLQPIGVAGELCIAGDILARGYLNRAELTAEKFVDNPYQPGERMYKTGDLARWLLDGNIEFLGRIDHQVKIRGFRIELGEIENQLLEHASVKEVTVIDREEQNGNKYLCAYLVGDGELKPQELREYLGKHLPDYMVPSFFIQLEKLPLTPNGKVDRKALPEPGGKIDTGVEYVAPRNEIETKLAQVWQEVLGLEKIGVNDNFFELGGHSLLIIQVHAKLGTMFKQKISVTDLFKYPTITALAKHLRTDKEQVEQSLQSRVSERVRKQKEAMNRRRRA